MSLEYKIIRSERRKVIYYDMHWSPYFRLEKHNVIRKIPSEGGIYQIFKPDVRRNLDLKVTAIAYYGGLRNTLRELLDPISPTQYPYKKMVADESCYVRFLVSSSMNDLEAVSKFYNRKEDEKDPDRKIRFQSIDSDKVFK